MLIQAVIWLFNAVLIICILRRLKSSGQALADFGIQKLDKTGMSGSRLILAALVLFITGILAFVLGSVVGSVFTEIPQQANLNQYNPLKGNLLLLLPAIFLVGFASSFGEELIYRAYLMDRVSRFLTKPSIARTVSIIISSLVFGFAHFQWGLMGIIQTFFMGLIFALAYLKFRGNIWVNVLAHFYMDTLLLIQMYIG
ncbi:MAG: CPBP family intramembrane metalloprotease [Calditrichaeota bacterium]|nr:CPBP family intramembrane metalloprotease [Calditrichota bacterium]